MIYRTTEPKELKALEFKYDYLVKNGKRVDLKEVKNTRSSLQNASLHKYFTMISEELNELGMEYRYFGVKGEVLSLMYTDNIVKQFFWKPIQLALFDIESTTKLTTEQLNQIIDVITKFFAEEGVLIEFPCDKNK